MARQGINYPKFADQFFRIDFEASPMPVLCLYPIPPPVLLEDLQIQVFPMEQHPRKTSWKAIESLPRVRLKHPLICQIFNWSEVVEWEGIRLSDFLDFVRLDTHPEGYFTIYSRDGAYFESLSRDEARDPRVLLAYGLNGAPLPEAHGGPLRLVVPFLQGYKSVKWVGGIRAFRNDPIGIKRLLGQSPSGQLNESWRSRFEIDSPPGKKGDPPAPAPGGGFGSFASSRAPGSFEPAQGTLDPPPGEAQTRIGTDSREVSTLREIMAVIRPQRHQATREALEAAGVSGYTAYRVLGRSRQRGLRLKSDFPSPQQGDVAIKFLPKYLFSIMVEASMVEKAVKAIIQSNRTGKGQYGDGKVFILDLDNAVRVSTDERGRDAI